MSKFKMEIEVEVEELSSPCDICFKSNLETSRLNDIGKVFRMLLSDSEIDVTDAYLDSMLACDKCMKSLKKISEFRETFIQNQILRKADELNDQSGTEDLECCICFDVKKKLIPINEFQSTVAMMSDTEIDMAEQCLSNSQCCQKCYNSLKSISNYKNIVIMMIGQQLKEAHEEEDETSSIVQSDDDSKNEYEDETFLNEKDFEDKPKNVKSQRITNTHDEELVKIFDDINKYDKPVSCEECKKVIKNEEFFNNHMKYTHGPNDKKRDYICDWCEMGYPTETLLKKHVQKVHKRKGQHCPFCEKVFPPPFGVTLHLNKAHRLPLLELLKTSSEGGYLICHYCDHSSSTSQGMYLHYVDKHKRKKREPQQSVQCDQCSKIFKARNLFNAHKRQVHDVSHNDSYCEECDIQFKNPYLLNAHRKRSARHAEKKFKCQFCGERFLLRSLLNGHIEYNHKNAGDKCLVCDKLCPPPLGLTQHLRRVHDLPNLKKGVEGQSCHLCGYVSQSTEDFYHHFKENHGGINPIKCDECDNVFNSRGSLNVHKREIHKVGFIINMEDENNQVNAKENSNSSRHPRFICDKCNIEYKSRNGILFHLRHSSAHVEKKIACHLCNKKFLSKEILDRHIRFLHEEKDGFLCPECGKRCFTTKDLSRHAMYHRNPCRLCKKKFLSKYLLDRHIRFSHDEKDGFLCPECGKRCCTTKDLSLHALSHRNRNHRRERCKDDLYADDHKPKVCEKCGKILKNSYCYKMHIKLMHMVENEFVYCEECGKEFKNKIQLKRHLANSLNHTVKKLKCPQCDKTFLTKPLLEGHIQYIHERKGHPCPICLKVFPPPYGMLQHLRGVHFKPNNNKLNNLDTSFK